MPNADLIRSLYAAFGRGDVKTILGAFDAVIEWASNGEGAVFRRGAGAP
jgi:ketosteroid isomerase-like protein